MSETVKEIIARAVKDETFRKALFADPTKALQEYELSPEDRELLANLSEENFDEFAGGLGDRSTKGVWTPGVS